MAKFDFASYEASQSRRTDSTQKQSVRKNSVGYFKLADDGDEAIVRFNYSSASEFDLVSTHTLKVGDRYKSISCLRNPYDPVEKCPLCEKGEKVSSRFFVKLVTYTRDENDQLVTKAVIWNRPASFAKQVKAYLDEYGDLRNYVFKIKRHGAKGEMSTTYDILPANPAIYKPEIYVADFSAFNGFDLKNHSYVEKTVDELKDFLITGEFLEPTRVNDTTSQTTTQVRLETPNDEEVSMRPRRYTY